MSEKDDRTGKTPTGTSKGMDEPVEVFGQGTPKIRVGVPQRADLLDHIVSRSEWQDDCLVWGGNKNSNGYGRVRHEGKRWGTHRLVWSLTYGPIPDGMCVCHSCDVPLCVNPDHLFLGTHTDNMRDMSQKLRGRPLGRPQKRTCTHGPDDFYTLPGGRRECRGCVHERDASRYAEEDPTYREARNERRRERYANDPAYRAAVAERKRKRKQRRRIEERFDRIEVAS